MDKGVIDVYDMRVYNRGQTVKRKVPCWGMLETDSEQCGDNFGYDLRFDMVERWIAYEEA